MRVGVNLLWCLPGQVGGSEEYLARQLLGLAAAAPDIEARLVVPPGYAAAHPELVGFEHIVGPSGLEQRAKRVAIESTWLPARLAGHDVVHHGGGTMPRRSPLPAVLTIHDLQWLRFPEYVAPVKRRYLAATVPASVRRAAVVAVPTEYVRATVIEAYGVDPDRVMVVPHGVDAPMEVTPADEVRARYGLSDRPFLVLPAITHPHKGHRFLLELLHGATGSWADPDLMVVLTGGAGRADAEVAATIRRLGLTDRVVRPGRVSPADRDGLIAAADAMVFPSQYEGFGAPVVEAMTLGTPVITSDHAALPEVVGEAGLVRPLVREAWLDALDEARSRRDQLVASGHRACRRLHHPGVGGGAGVRVPTRR